MEKKLRQLFDYQKFADNKELSDAIALCDDSPDVSKANPTGKSAFSRYKSSILTMAGSAAAAALLVVLNLFFAGTGGATAQPVIGSLFAEGNAGFIAAGVILALGIAVSFLLYKKNKENTL